MTEDIVKSCREGESAIARGRARLTPGGSGGTSMGVKKRKRGNKKKARYQRGN